MPRSARKRRYSNSSRISCSPSTIRRRYRHTRAGHFTVAMNKFTIPDNKRLVIEIQEKNGGRHFLYKLKNKSLLDAEEVFRNKKQQETEEEADRILRRIAR